MIEWLNDNSGAVQAIAVVVLIIVTAVYAVAARRQAAASVRMAEEMREQRLGEDRPHVWIDLTDDEPNMAKVQLAKGQTIHDCCPTCLKLKLQNVGRGPAKDVMATAVHHREIFDVERRGYLLKGESWKFDLPRAILSFSIRRRSPPRALNDWLADRQIHAPMPIHSPLGVVVEYRDIHERAWTSYLELQYECETGDEENELIWWIEPGKQSSIGPVPSEGS